MAIVHSFSSAAFWPFAPDADAMMEVYRRCTLRGGARLHAVVHGWWDDGGSSPLTKRLQFVVQPSARGSPVEVLLWSSFKQLIDSVLVRVSDLRSCANFEYFSQIMPSDMAAALPELDFADPSEQFDVAGDFTGDFAGDVGTWCVEISRCVKVTPLVEALFVGDTGKALEKTLANYRRLQLVHLDPFDVIDYKHPSNVPHHLALPRYHEQSFLPNLIPYEAIKTARSLDHLLDCFRDMGWCIDTIDGKCCFQHPLLMFLDFESIDDVLAAVDLPLIHELHTRWSTTNAPEVKRFKSCDLPTVSSQVVFA